MSYNEFQNLRLIDAKTFTKATNFRGQFFSALLDVVIQSALVCGQLLESIRAFFTNAIYCHVATSLKPSNGIFDLLFLCKNLFAKIVSTGNGLRQFFRTSLQVRNRFLTVDMHR